MAMQLIVEAIPQDNYMLKLKFKNGSVRLLDMKPVIKRGGVFAPLKNKATFDKVKVQFGFGGLEWPTGADYCPDAAYEDSKPYPSRSRRKEVNQSTSAMVLEEIEKV